MDQVKKSTHALGIHPKPARATLKYVSCVVIMQHGVCSTCCKALFFLPCTAHQILNAALFTTNVSNHPRVNFVYWNFCSSLFIFPKWCLAVVFPFKYDATLCLVQGIQRALFFVFGVCLYAYPTHTPRCSIYCWSHTTKRRRRSSVFGTRKLLFTFWSRVCANCALQNGCNAHAFLLGLNFLCLMYLRREENRLRVMVCAPKPFYSFCDRCFLLLLRNTLYSAVSIF